MDTIQGGMMSEIVYREINEFEKSNMQNLFLSVEWSSGHFPGKLQIAMRNFETVISAWDENRLVGMICAMDDGIMTAYTHYLLEMPDYRDQGIGKHLVEKVKDIYRDYLRIVVVGYDEIGFYESCCFEKAEDASPLFITDLWT